MVAFGTNKLSLLNSGNDHVFVLDKFANETSQLLLEPSARGLITVVTESTTDVECDP